MKKQIYFLHLLLLVVWLINGPSGMAQTMAMAGPKNTHQSVPSVSPETTVRSLKEVLIGLKSRFKVDILFADRVVNGLTVTKKIDPNLALESVLAAVLQPVGLDYKKVKKGTYLITEHRASQKADARFPEVESNAEIEITAVNNNQSALEGVSQQVVPKEMKPADVNVHGRVTDSDKGEALPGVSVVVKGTTRGTTTDANGNYQVAVPDGSTTLVFSFVGYAAQEVVVGNRTTLNIKMAVSDESLNEVVVVGYGTQKKSDLTGSVVSLNEKSFNKGAIVSADQLLVGRVPGVQVTQSNGEPGGGFSVRIRGSSSITAGNDPLYVIDGFPIDNTPLLSSSSGGKVSPNFSPRNPLNSLNPADIESIEILKDASATAIYGSRGANGVILITTKKGSKSGGVEVDYNLYTSTQSVAKKLDVMNRDQYIKAINEISVAQGQKPIYTDQQIADIVAAGIDTDWQSEIFRPAPINNHALTVKGTQNNTQYYASLNYFDQKGIVINSGIKKYIFRLNLNQKIGTKLKFGLNANGSLVQDQYVSYGQGSVTNAGVINSAIDFEPTKTIFDVNGNYSESSILPNLDNSVAIANLINNGAVTNRLLVSTFAEYEIIKGLSGKVYFGADRQNQRRDTYIPSTLRRTLGISNASIATLEKNSYIFEGTLNYNKTIANAHTVSALVGYTFQQFATRSFDGQVSNFSSDLTTTNNLGLGDPATAIVGSNLSDNSLLSYLGRINYNYKDKLLFTTSYRIDGSSRFGENNKFGFFPSFALGYRLENEEFISNLSFFDQLKIRASWGQTGNQEIGNFASLGTFSGGVAVIDNKLTATASPARLPNPNLKWETTIQTNFGLDFGFFRNRIRGSVDYFTKNTKDLLLDLPVPISTGFQTILSNVGSVRNKGVEFMLETENLTGKFGWKSGFNLAKIKNEVVSLGGDIKEIITGQVAFTSQFALVRPGEPLYAYYGHRVTGIFQNEDQIAKTPKPASGAKPGNPIFADLNNDGIIDNKDRTVLGSPYPKMTFGLSNNFRYGNFQLDIFAQGQYGSSVLNNNLMLSLYPANTPINRLAEPILNRWTPTNPSNTWPSSVNPSTYGVPEGNSLIILDNSFLRLRSVQLSYTIPITKVKWLRAASVNLNAQNLYTFTNYMGFDPEVSSLGRSGIVVDYNAYPMARTFSLGLNLGF